MEDLSSIRERVLHHFVIGVIKMLYNVIQQGIAACSEIAVLKLDYL
jgi:hypothetical protein